LRRRRGDGEDSEKQRGSGQPPGQERRRGGGLAFGRDGSGPIQAAAVAAGERERRAAAGTADEWWHRMFLSPAMPLALWPLPDPPLVIAPWHWLVGPLLARQWAEDVEPVGLETYDTSWAGGLWPPVGLKAKPQVTT
jgi:hypothetical protein